MRFDEVRHYARYVVNATALALAVLALPELGAIVPTAWLPSIATMAATLNTILSWARRVT